MLTINVSMFELDWQNGRQCIYRQPASRLKQATEIGVLLVVLPIASVFILV